MGAREGCWEGGRERERERGGGLGGFGRDWEQAMEVGGSEREGKGGSDW